jgi:hypothetical protein
MTANDAKDARKRQEEREAQDAKRKQAEEKKVREAAHDHTIAESMVASDPPSSIPDPRDEDALEEDSRLPAREEEEERK